MTTAATLLVDVKDGPAASEAVVAASIDHFANAKETQGARAHDAWLTRHVQLCPAPWSRFTTQSELSCSVQVMIASASVPDIVPSLLDMSPSRECPGKCCLAVVPGKSALQERRKTPESMPVRACQAASM